jgi:pimeloyl-ACP methyl ester carboxylesterase
MSEMPFAQALRWARDRTRAKLQMGLNAFEYRTKIAPRPFLLLYGTEDRLVTRSPLQVWDAPEKPWITHQVIQGAGHLDLLDHPTTLHTVARWLKEHL